MKQAARREGRCCCAACRANIAASASATSTSPCRQGLAVKIRCLIGIVSMVGDFREARGLAV